MEDYKSKTPKIVRIMKPDLLETSVEWPTLEHELLEAVYSVLIEKNQRTNQKLGTLYDKNEKIWGKYRESFFVEGGALSKILLDDGDRKNAVIEYQIGLAKILRVKNSAIETAERTYTEPSSAHSSPNKNQQALRQARNFKAHLEDKGEEAEIERKKSQKILYEKYLLEEENVKNRLLIASDPDLKKSYEALQISGLIWHVFCGDSSSANLRNKSKFKDRVLKLKIDPVATAKDLDLAAELSVLQGFLRLRIKNAISYSSIGSVIVDLSGKSAANKIENIRSVIETAIANNVLTDKASKSLRFKKAKREKEEEERKLREIEDKKNSIATETKGKIRESWDRLKSQDGLRVKELWEETLKEIELEDSTRQILKIWSDSGFFGSDCEFFKDVYGESPTLEVLNECRAKLKELAGTIATNAQEVLDLEKIRKEIAEKNKELLSILGESEVKFEQGEELIKELIESPQDSLALVRAKSQEIESKQGRKEFCDKLLDNFNRKISSTNEKIKRDLALAAEKKKKAEKDNAAKIALLAEEERAADLERRRLETENIELSTRESKSADELKNLRRKIAQRRGQLSEAWGEKAPNLILELASQQAGEKSEGVKDQGLIDILLEMAKGSEVVLNEALEEKSPSEKVDFLEEIAGKAVGFLHAVEEQVIEGWDLFKIRNLQEEIGAQDQNLVALANQYLSLHKLCGEKKVDSKGIKDFLSSFLPNSDFGVSVETALAMESDSKMNLYGEYLNKGSALKTLRQINFEEFDKKRSRKYDCGDNSAWSRYGNNFDKCFESRNLLYQNRKDVFDLNSSLEKELKREVEALQAKFNQADAALELKLQQDALDKKVSEEKEAENQRKIELETSRKEDRHKDRDEKEEKESRLFLKAQKAELEKAELIFHTKKKSQEFDEELLRKREAADEQRKSERDAYEIENGEKEWIKKAEELREVGDKNKTPRSRLNAAYPSGNPLDDDSSSDKSGLDQKGKEKADQNQMVGASSDSEGDADHKILKLLAGKLQKDLRELKQSQEIELLSFGSAQEEVKRSLEVLKSNLSEQESKKSLLEKELSELKSSLDSLRGASELAEKTQKEEIDKLKSEISENELKLTEQAQQFSKALEDQNALSEEKILKQKLEISQLEDGLNELKRSGEENEADLQKLTKEEAENVSSHVKIEVLRGLIGEAERKQSTLATKLSEAEKKLALQKTLAAGTEKELSDQLAAIGDKVALLEQTRKEKLNGALSGHEQQRALEERLLALETTLTKTTLANEKSLLELMSGIESGKSKLSASVSSSEELSAKHLLVQEELRSQKESASRAGIESDKKISEQLSVIERIELELGRLKKPDTAGNKEWKTLRQALSDLNEEVKNLTKQLSKKGGAEVSGAAPSQEELENELRLAWEKLDLKEREIAELELKLKELKKSKDPKDPDGFNIEGIKEQFEEVNKNTKEGEPLRDPDSEGSVISSKDLKDKLMAEWEASKESTNEDWYNYSKMMRVFYKVKNLYVDQNKELESDFKEDAYQTGFALTGGDIKILKKFGNDDLEKGFENAKFVISLIQKDELESFFKGYGFKKDKEGGQKYSALIQRSDGEDKFHLQIEKVSETPSSEVSAPKSSSLPFILKRTPLVPTK